MRIVKWPQKRLEFHGKRYSRRQCNYCLKNQGLYNGFLAVGILYSLFVIPAVASVGATLFFLACVMVAAVYGSITVSRAIVVIQGLPALIAFILMYFA